jgi:hypothetical protein
MTQADEFPNLDRAPEIARQIHDIVVLCGLPDADIGKHATSLRRIIGAYLPGKNLSQTHAKVLGMYLGTLIVAHSLHGPAKMKQFLYDNWIYAFKVQRNEDDPGYRPIPDPVPFVLGEFLDYLKMASLKKPDRHFVAAADALMNSVVLSTSLSARSLEIG